MENVTYSVWTDHTQFIEYKVSVMMWTFLPPIIIALGTFGNMFTILVMSRIKDNNSSQYAILMVLAIADLCLLYSGLLNRWLWEAFKLDAEGTHTVSCKLIYWVTYASGTSSAWLVTTVTVQRTMAVLWPHRMRVMCTVRRTWIVISVVVITACSVHLHMLTGFLLIDNSYCSTTDKYWDFFVDIWNWVDVSISSLAPSICLLVCSVVLAWTLFKSTSLSSTSLRATSSTNTGHSRDSRKSDAVKVTVMILTLSCTFLILTLPVCIYVVWADLRAYGIVDPSPRSDALEAFLSMMTFLMWYTNSAVNFLLYCLTGTRFRREFLSLLLCCANGPIVGETTGVQSTEEGNRQQKKGRSSQQDRSLLSP